MLQSLYVLEGEVLLNAGDRELSGGPGAFLQAAPGVSHALTFSASAPVHYLRMRTPSP